MLKTAVISDRHYLEHFSGRHHPERPERVKVLMEMVENLRRPGLELIAPKAATRSEIELCHRPEYLDFVAHTAERDFFDFDPDTHACRATYQTALLAAGGVLTGVDAVLEGAAQNAFAIVRPPGHHALPDRAMGFCFFNNVAIAASYLTARKGLARVMVIDWDLHHGNGTQDIFYSRSDILYCSLHQFPHYPGTGAINELGQGPGRGFTVNLPMPATFGDPEYYAAFDRVVLNVGRRFRPDFILVSAGFDCHYRDPLGDIRVTEDGFTAMTRRVKRLAAECCDGRLLLALEGGYDLPAIGHSGQAVLEELGREADEPIAGSSGGRGEMILDRVAQALSPWWDISA